MESIKSAWQRIEAWHDKNTPEEIFTLAAGASEKEIAHFEKEIGFRLPDDLRASFALHNGTLEEDFLVHYGELLSLERILAQHKQYLQWQQEDGWGLAPDFSADEIEGPIKPLWWNPLRLALTDNSGDAIMADFDPAPGGQAGQIIVFDQEVGPSEVLAPSFAEWLTSLADALENGEFVYDEDEATVGPPDYW